jgi:L-lactate dehydrogenase
MRRKVTIVGAGAVGSTFAYALAQNGVAREIALLDQNKDLMEGHVLDLVHGMPFYPPVDIHNGSKKDYADSEVIVITAGASQKPGETRLQLLQKNADIIKSIMDDIIEQQSDAVVLMVANPVDVLTHVALKHSRWNRERIIGSGTVLDTSRFRYQLSQYFKVDVRNVHAYILGEHGDSEIAPWSMAHLAGLPLQDYVERYGDPESWEEDKKQIVQKVRDSAYHIINYKGATYFAVGLALTRIVGAILQQQRSLLTTSIYLKGEYGIDDICMSVPCTISSGGVQQILEADLADEELEGLKRSGSVLREAMEELDF